MKCPLLILLIFLSFQVKLFSQSIKRDSLSFRTTYQDSTIKKMTDKNAVYYLSDGRICGLEFYTDTGSDSTNSVKVFLAQDSLNPINYLQMFVLTGDSFRIFPYHFKMDFKEGMVTELGNLNDYEPEKVISYDKEGNMFISYYEKFELISKYKVLENKGKLELKRVKL